MSRPEELVCFFILLFIASAITMTIGWIDYSKGVSSTNRWHKAECNITSIITEDYSVCSKEVCINTDISGTSFVGDTTVPFSLEEQCKIGDTVCLEKYSVGQIVSCWYDKDNVWRFDEPKSYNKNLFKFTLLSTIYSSLFCFIFCCCRARNY